MGAVYEIRNRLNGKCYIGSTVHVEQRFARHRALLRKGRHHSRHLQQAWDKYEEAAFRFCVLCEAATDEELRRLEQEYIERKKPAYNVSKNTTAFALGLHWTVSDERRAQLSERNRHQVKTPTQRAQFERIRHLGQPKAIAARVQQVRERGRLPHEREATRKGVTAMWAAMDETQKRERLEPLWAARRGKPPWNQGRQATTLSPCAKLTADQVRDIRARYAAGGVTQTALAQEFGISRSRLSNIIWGKTYRGGQL